MSERPARALPRPLLLAIPLALTILLTPPGVLLVQVLYADPAIEAFTRFGTEPVYALYRWLTVGVPLFALLGGGAAERLFGAVYLGSVFAYVPLAAANDSTAALQGTLVLNLIILLVLLGIALRGGPRWSFFAAGLQLIQFAVLLAAFLDSRIKPLTWALAAGLWDYLLLAVFAYGSWQALQRRLDRAARPEAA